MRTLLIYVSGVAAIITLVVLGAASLLETIKEMDEADGLLHEEMYHE